MILYRQEAFSRRRFVKKAVLKNFAKFTGKYVSKFPFNKLQASGLQFFLKIKSDTGVFL